MYIFYIVKIYVDTHLKIQKDLRFKVNDYGATIYYACGIYVTLMLIILYNVSRVSCRIAIASPAQGRAGRAGEGWKNTMESCSRPSSAITHTCRGHYASLKRPDRPYYVRRGSPLVGPLGRAGPHRLSCIAGSNIIFDGHDDSGSASTEN